MNLKIIFAVITIPILISGCSFPGPIKETTLISSIPATHTVLSVNEDLQAANLQLKRGLYPPSFQWGETVAYESPREIIEDHILWGKVTYRGGISVQQKEEAESIKMYVYYWVPGIGYSFKKLPKEHYTKIEIKDTRVKDRQ